MGMDLTQAPLAQAAAPSTAAEVSTEAPPAEVEAVPAEAEPEEEEVSFDTPWIDTMRCTTCNDCMKINPLTFIYNDNKQALIGDAKAATFEQLVIADPYDFEYPSWPPRFMVDAVHWWGRTFDPLLMARPTWWKVIS